MNLKINGNKIRQSKLHAYLWNRNRYVQKDIEPTIGGYVGWCDRLWRIKTIVPHHWLHFSVFKIWSVRTKYLCRLRKCVLVNKMCFHEIRNFFVVSFPGNVWSEYVTREYVFGVYWIYPCCFKHLWIKSPSQESPQRWEGNELRWVCVVSEWRIGSQWGLKRYTSDGNQFIIKTQNLNTMDCQ